jgi:hypothetical protein
MTQRSFQEALVRIYTDWRFRESIISRQSDPLNDYCLTPEERDRLLSLGLQRERVLFFCDLLEDKRAKAVGTFIPALRALLGPRWRSFWDAYMQVEKREVALSPEEVASSFAGFVVERAAEEEDSILGAVARYELNRLTISLSPRISSCEPGKSFTFPDVNEHRIPLVQRPYCIEAFDVDMFSLIRSLKSSGQLLAIRHEPTTILFYRHCATNGPTTARIIAPYVFALLELFDGRSTLAELASKLAAISGGTIADVSEQLFKCTAALTRNGVLCSGLSKPMDT